MLVVGLAAYFKFFGNRLIFYPETTIAAVPRIPYDDVAFTADDGTKLNGWFMPFPGADRVFVISHGNAGNIGDRSELGQYVRQELQSAVFLYDYRGYGRSEGKPSEAGLYSDLRGALRYVGARGYAPDEIYLMGQSLGTAVTVEVASRENVAGIILEAPFPGVQELVRSYTFSIPVDYFLSARFDSDSKIQAVRSPIAVIHARKDPVIPFVLGQRLFDTANDPKEFFAVEGEIHEGALMALGVVQMRQLREFLFKKSK
jgi:fermentation-respiration switch protein FrsA (DUF1100 family)